MEANNMAAMREALQRMVDWFNDGGFDEDAADEMDSMVEKAEAALAAPPRQCDVGTAEEQAQRFYAFCQAHQSEIEGMCSDTCPCLNCGDKCHCLCKWAQMPYEEGGEK